MIVRSALPDLELQPDFETVFESREALEPYMELFPGQGPEGRGQCPQNSLRPAKALFDYGSNSFSDSEAFHLDNFIPLLMPS